MDEHDSDVLDELRQARCAPSRADSSKLRIEMSAGIRVFTLHGNDGDRAAK
jgi:hypothetical protein